MEDQPLLVPTETSVDPRSPVGDQSPKEQLLHRMKTSPLAVIYSDVIEKIEACGEHYGVWEVDNQIVVHAMHCKHRGCPACQKIKAASRRKEFDQTLLLMSSPKMITLTVRSNDEPLRDQVKHLTESFRRLRQRSFWQRRRIWGYWVLEVTYNATTARWHPHLHVICNSPFLPVQVLSEHWLQVTGDSPIVDVRKIDRQGLAGYLSGYVTKMLSLWGAPVDPFQLLEEMKGLRMLNQFGHFPLKYHKQIHHCIFLGTVAGIVKRSYYDEASLDLVRYLMRECPGIVLRSDLHPPPEDQWRKGTLE